MKSKRNQRFAIFGIGGKIIMMPFGSHEWSPFIIQLGRAASLEVGKIFMTPFIIAM